MERLIEILNKPNATLKDGETLIHIADNEMTVFSVENGQIHKTSGRRDMVMTWLNYIAYKK